MSFRTLRYGRSSLSPGSKGLPGISLCVLIGCLCDFFWFEGACYAVVHYASDKSFCWC